MQQLLLRNQQRARRIDRRHICRLTRSVLHEDLAVSEYDLAIHLVGESAMIRLNETHLQHSGSTDVITFDYCDPAQREVLSGEIFICVPEAIIQARRFRSTWQSEVVRYIIHGLLHLRGYDDKNLTKRRVMKQQENKILRALAIRFSISRIGGHTVERAR